MPNFIRQNLTLYEQTIKNQSALVHTVMITYRDEIPQDIVENSVERLRSLGTLPGVMKWVVEWSLDQRKGRTVLELGIFESGDAFLQWRNHRDHTSFADELATLADWHTADFSLSAANIGQNP
jgi:hypothetical protein